jgi:hypothetical protein
MTRGTYLPDELHNPYYNPYAENGQEVSSTFEGRHVQIEEGWLYHRDLGGAMIQKGQPFMMPGGAGVGIALKTATSRNDVIPADTEGIWRLEVWAQDDIYIGEVLWICDDGSGTDGIITDDPLVSSGMPAIIGYAMEPYTFQTNGIFNVVTLAVKVHWMSWWWFFDGV